MVNYTDLPKRIFNKLLRITSLDQPFLIGTDKVKDTIFLLNKTKLQEQQATFDQCESLEDFYEFAKDVFGPHQDKVEILSFLEFVRNEKPINICEIGTADGGTNFLLTHALLTPTFMLGIDLYVKKKAKLSYFAKDKVSINFIDGSSYEPSSVSKAEAIIGNKKLDLLFIDGDHTYEGVSKDFFAYKRFVRDGGLIVFHDIVPDYFTRYGKRTGPWVGDVPQFWQKIKDYYPHWEFVRDPEQDGLGIGVIRYSSSNEIPRSLLSK